MRFFWIWLFSLVLSCASGAWCQDTSDYVERLRRVAIQQGGRIKPLDTFAAESVRYLTGKSEFEQRDPVLTLVQWWAQGPKVAELAVIEFRHQQWKARLGLAAERRHFSANELNRCPELASIREQIHGLKEGEKLPNELAPAQDLLNKLAFLEMLARGAAWSLVPSPHSLSDGWSSLADLEGQVAPALAPSASAAQAFRQAVAQGQGEEKALEQLTQSLQSVGPYPDAAALEREVHYNHFHPFRKAWMLYLLSLIVLCFSGRGTQLYGFGVLAALGGWALHVYGFYLRCLIAGRPPVTNMYESVIWVAFGAISLALFFEARFRARSYLMAACAGAIACLALADQLPAVLDPSIKPLMPVLRNNFWLTIHVLTITLGYAAFLLALGLGHMVLWKHWRGPDQREELGGLHQALYKAIQVGVVLLAAGTLLGGVWANYSWGRFWGWDPKEVWALIALLGYLAILHARFTGWIGAFGIACWSVLAFQGVLMAWYGVNFVLGAGLHSYGFGTGGGGYVACFCLAEVAFVAWVAQRQRRTRLQVRD